MTDPLHESLSTSLDNLTGMKDKFDSVALPDILSAVGDKGFGIFLIILSGPSALPVPAPGYSTPFGVLLIGLGLQMLLGREIPWLPQWSGKLTLKGDFLDKLVRFMVGCLKWLELFIKPRMRWIGSRYGRPFMGILVILMAFLMIIPIPLTNTFPAIVIFLIGIGLCEDDGLFSILACLVGIFSVFLYSAVLYIFFKFGIEGVERLKESILDYLG